MQKKEDKESRKKALKKLGISPDHLLTQALDGDHKGSLKLRDHLQFWDQIQGDNKETTTFMENLLAKLKAECAAAAAAPNLPPSDLLLAIVATVHFICLTMEFEATSNKIQEHQITSELECVKDVLRTLAMLGQKEDLVGPILNSFSTNLLSAEELKTFHNVVDFPTVEPKAPAVRPDNVFLFTFIKSSLKAGGSEEQRNQIVSSITDKFFQLPQVKHTNPVMADMSVLALLHALRQLLAFCPCTDRELVDRCAKQIRAFLIWPRPIGSTAKKCLELLQTEESLPGNAMRVQLKYDNLGPRIPPSLRREGDSEEARILYHFSISTCDKSSNMSSMMDNKVLETDKLKAEPLTPISDGLTATTKAMLLLSMLAAEKTIGAGVAEASKASSLKEEDVRKLWEDAQKLIQEVSSSRDAAQAKQLRLTRLAALKSALNACKGGGDCVNLPENAHANGFVTPGPSFSSYGVVKPKAYTEDLLTDTTSARPAPITPFMEPLKYILAQCQEEKREIELRLVVQGGSNALHSLLCAVAHINTMYPKSFQNLRVVVFLLPTEFSLTAAYLARTDPWYRRHVYTPFNSHPLVVPWAATMKDEGGAPPPGGVGDVQGPSLVGQALKGLLVDYIRDAQNIVKVRVFNVEAWVDVDQEAKVSRSDQKIPFIEGVSFLFTGESPEMVVKVVKMDYTGGKSSFNNESCNYKSIELMNMPTGPSNFAADPTSPWLEMCAVVSKNARLGGNVMFSGDPKHHVAEIDATCVDRNGSFKMLIDGQERGPFHRVKISAAICLNSDSVQEKFSLSLATFLPPNLA